MKRILMSLVVIGIVGSIALASTGAFFSDTETSTNNTLEAGEVDLLVGFQGYYNKEVDGNPNSGEWQVTDLSREKFFDFYDVKPGDKGVGLLTLHVNSNDSWACLTVDNLFDDEMTCTEPEIEAEAIDGQCIAGNEGYGGGDLASNLYFTMWLDDGDGVWQSNETFLLQNQLTDLKSLVNQVIPIADATTNNGPLSANNTYTIASRWCAGEMTIDAQSETIGCSGQSLGNESQTDMVTADISFNVVQSRNNNQFRCNEAGAEELVYFENFNTNEKLLIGGGFARFWNIAPIDGAPGIPSYFTTGGEQGGSIYYGSFAKGPDGDPSPSMSILLPDLTAYTDLELIISLAAPDGTLLTNWEITHRDKLIIESNLGEIDRFLPRSSASPLYSSVNDEILKYEFQDFHYDISSGVTKITFTFASTDYDEVIGIDSLRIFGKRL